MADHGAGQVRVHLSQGSERNISLECGHPWIKEVDYVPAQHHTARQVSELRVTSVSTATCPLNEQNHHVSPCCPLLAGVHASEAGADVATPLSLMEWFHSFYDASHPSSSPTPLEGIVREGEILFVPRGWWHLAMNLEVRSLLEGLPSSCHTLSDC